MNGFQVMTLIAGALSFVLSVMSIRMTRRTQKWLTEEGREQGDDPEPETRRSRQRSPRVTRKTWYRSNTR